MEGRRHAATGWTVHQQRMALRHPRTLSTMAWEQKRLSARERRARGHDTAGWAERGCGTNGPGIWPFIGSSTGVRSHACLRAVLRIFRLTRQVDAVGTCTLEAYVKKLEMHM